MTMLRYRLRPQSRLTAGKGGEVVHSKETHSILPGGTIRGALGWMWINRSESSPLEAAADFAANFLPFVSMGQAVPVPVGVDPAVAGDRFSRLQHFSLAACKHPSPACALLGGWTSDQSDSAWWDTAVAGPADAESCPGCQNARSGDWTYGRGWRHDPGLITATTRSALAMGVPVNQQLFTRELIDRGHEFVGTIRLKEGAPDRLIDWLLEDRRLRVGGERSTLGDCLWSAAKRSDHGPAPTRLADGRAVLVLRSPSVLIDAMGGASQDLAGFLATQTKAGGTSVRPGWTRPTQITGWNGKAGMTRPADEALAAGSVAVLDANWTDEELSVIAAGIGLRRSEGCGEVAFVTKPQPSLRDLALIPEDHQIAPIVVRPTGQEEAPDVCHLLADSLSWDRHNAVLDSVIDAAREIRAVLERGSPAGVAMMQASAVLQFPWAKDLGPESRDHVARLLRNDKEAAAYTREQHLAHLVGFRSRGPQR